MKKNIFLTIIMSGLLLGAYGFASAGWLDSIVGGFDCAGKIANCNKNVSECKRRVQQEANKCETKYQKDIRNQAKYQAKAETYAVKCATDRNSCRTRAQRYKDPTKYITNCEAKYNTCTVRAQERRARDLERASQVLERAQERKSTCEAKYSERQSANIERCASQGRRCLQNLIKKCGSLVPSI